MQFWFQSECMVVEEGALCLETTSWAPSTMLHHADIDAHPDQCRLRSVCWRQCAHKHSNMNSIVILVTLSDDKDALCLKTASWVSSPMLSRHVAPRWQCLKSPRFERIKPFLVSRKPFQISENLCGDWDFKPFFACGCGAFVFNTISTIVSLC